jgi:DNA-binding NarL/FixJ family response regulator
LVGLPVPPRIVCSAHRISGPGAYAESVAAPQPSDARRTSVLLADDDPRFRRLVRSLLEDDGYAVVAEAGSAVEAVTLAVEHRPDVVLLDLVMPEIDPASTDDGTDVVIDLLSVEEPGLRAAVDLVERLPETRVVIVSSLFDSRIQTVARRLGVAYVEKIDGLDGLEAAIEGTRARA